MSFTARQTQQHNDNVEPKQQPHVKQLNQVWTQKYTEKSSKTATIWFDLSTHIVRS